MNPLAEKSKHSIPNLLDISINLSKWHQYFKFVPIIYCVIIAILWALKLTSILLITCILFLIFNSFIHYWNKSYVEYYIRPLGQLSKIRYAAINISQIDKYTKLEPINESVSYIDKLSNKMTLFGLNKLFESDLIIVFYVLIEFFKMIFLVESIVINVVSKEIVNIKLHSKRLIDYLGGWDVLYSTSSLRVWLKNNDYSWSTPTFTESNSTVLSATEMYHPLIIDCIPNSIEIDKTIIITGSNMSGKSSFIKALGLNVVSSYAINTCFAANITLPDCRLHTVLSVSDDINDSKSYYMCEAQRVKLIIDKCESSSFGGINIVLIDEIFKGTNTIERIAIANAVIKYFISLTNTVMIVSTHDIELAKSFSKILNIYHFNEDMDNNKLRFNYKLTPGGEYNRNAISILKSCNYPKSIISCAKDNVHKICKNLNFDIL